MAGTEEVSRPQPGTGQVRVQLRDSLSGNVVRNL